MFVWIRVKVKVRVRVRVSISCISAIKTLNKYCSKRNGNDRCLGEVSLKIA